MFNFISSKSAVIVPFTACPSEFCFDDIFAAFDKCAPHFFAGCTTVPTLCSDGPGFVCTKRGAADTEVEVKPGEPIVLEKVKLYTTYKFKVNLSALPLDTDFYLLSDATGSMGGAISNVRSQFGVLVDFFKSNSKNPFFGVGYYRDEKERGMTNGFENSQAITSDVKKVKQAISTLRATGGGDGDEANLVALYKVATTKSIGWRSNSRRILVYFGDWPGHEPTCFDGKTITRKEVIEALKEAKITVIAVSFPPPGLDRVPTALSRCVATGSAGSNQATDITKSTLNGAITTSRDQSKLITTITDAIKNIDREFDVDTSDCDGNVATESTPTLPAMLSVGSHFTIEQKVQILFGACSPSKKFTCKLKYSESGADLGAVDFTALSIEGCD